MSPQKRTMLILNLLLLLRGKKKKKSAWIQVSFDPYPFPFSISHSFNKARLHLCFTNNTSSTSWPSSVWLLWVLALKILSVESCILPFILGFIQRMLSSSSVSILEHRFPAWLCRTNATLPGFFLWLCSTLSAVANSRRRVLVPSDAVCHSPDYTLAYIPVYQCSLWLPFLN